MRFALFLFLALLVAVHSIDPAICNAPTMAVISGTGLHTVDYHYTEKQASNGICPKTEGKPSCCPKAALKALNHIFSFTKKEMETLADQLRDEGSAALKPLHDRAVSEFAHHNCAHRSLIDLVFKKDLFKCVEYASAVGLVEAAQKALPPLHKEVRKCSENVLRVMVGMGCASCDTAFAAAPKLKVKENLVLDVVQECRPIANVLVESGHQALTSVVDFIFKQKDMAGTGVDSAIDSEIVDQLTEMVTKILKDATEDFKGTVWESFIKWILGGVDAARVLDTVFMMRPSYEHDTRELVHSSSFSEPARIEYVFAKGSGVIDVEDYGKDSSALDGVDQGTKVLILIGGLVVILGAGYAGYVWMTKRKPSKARPLNVKAYAPIY